MKLPISSDEIKEFLDDKVNEYNSPHFIESDPIAIPHKFQLKEDIEIAGFLTSTIAWGNRKMIIRNAKDLMNRFGDSPYDFVMSHKSNDLDSLVGFVHRTFNETDLRYFIKSLRNIYENHGGLETIFLNNQRTDTLQPAITELKRIFFELKHYERTLKHVSDPQRGSAAKRLNMWLRWLVRDDNRGVDFGIWKSLKPSQLSCPLDVHSGRVARKLGLLTRTQNDAKALAELDEALRLLDPIDPAKYDFALFGLGVFENF